MTEYFTDADREQLRERGVAEQAATEQIERLSSPPRFVELVRACTPGDGIRIVPEDEVDELGLVADGVARGGRVLKLVPASGAATRMFRSLLAFSETGGPPSRAALDAEVAAGNADAQALETFLRGVRRFAFAEELRAILARRGEDLDSLADRGPFAPILAALLTDEGLGYARLPKGLLKFHSYPEGARTAFEEHLVEAAHVVKSAGGVCRLHLTVSPDHAEGFESLLESMRKTYERSLGATFEVELSTQKPSTDTLAIDHEGRPFRLADGTLLFRPAGHGALIENLAALDADWVWIKNIDNVVPDRLKEETHRWGRALIGLGVRVQRQTFDLLARLEDGGRDERSRERAIDDAVRFADESLGVDLGPRVAATPAANRRNEIARILERPIRVCGMVRNTGEPGGGPFWSRSGGGAVSCQIVEMSEVDPDSSTQREIAERATHFNPVFMVCGLTDRSGGRYDLRRFVDGERSIVVRKSFEGRELRALELPGLWNGAMAHWNTLFVEVPGIVFNPVKTIDVLLQEAHQPR